MQQREKMIARNVSTRSLSLGLDFVPPLKPGDQVDLLLYITKGKVSTSSSLKTYIQRGQVEVDKYKDDIFLETVDESNVDTALSLAEESDLTDTTTYSADIEALTLRADFSPLKGPEIHGTPWRARNTSNLASGQNDIYTVPSGKMLIITNRILRNNHGSSSGSYYDTATISGTTIRLNSTVSPAAGAHTNIDCFYVLDEGEVFGVNASIAAGIYCYRGILVTKTAVPQLKRPAFINFQAAINSYTTIYTCPANKIAFVLTNEFDFYTSPAGSNGGGGIIYNSTGGTITSVAGAIVPTGQSDATTWLINVPASHTNNTFNNTRFAGAAMSAGDILKLATGTAISVDGYHVLVPIWEMSV